MLKLPPALYLSKLVNEPDFHLHLCSNYHLIVVWIERAVFGRLASDMSMFEKADSKMVQKRH